MNATLNHGTYDTLEQFAEMSYKIKSAVNEQELIDEILNGKNKADERIQVLTCLLEEVDELLQSLTWKENAMDLEKLAKVDAILSIGRGLLEYLENSKINKGKLAKFCSGSLDLYNDQIDLLEETIQDLHDIFFVLPHDLEFVALNKRLEEEM